MDKELEEEMNGTITGPTSAPKALRASALEIQNNWLLRAINLLEGNGKGLPSTGTFPLTNPPILVSETRSRSGQYPQTQVVRSTLPGEGRFSWRMVVTHKYEELVSILSGNNEQRYSGWGSLPLAAAQLWAELLLRAVLQVKGGHQLSAMAGLQSRISELASAKLRRAPMEMMAEWSNVAVSIGTYELLGVDVDSFANCCGARLISNLYSRVPGGGMVRPGLNGILNVHYLSQGYSRFVGIIADPPNKGFLKMWRGWAKESPFDYFDCVHDEKPWRNMRYTDHYLHTVAFGYRPGLPRVPSTLRIPAQPADVLKNLGRLRGLAKSLGSRWADTIREELINYPVITTRGLSGKIRSTQEG